MANMVPRAYSGGLGAMASVRSRGKAPGQGSGTTPPEAENNFKTKSSILCSGFDYFTFWCCPIFRQLLLACYMPIRRKTRLTEFIAVTFSGINRSCLGGLSAALWLASPPPTPFILSSESS